MVANYMCNNNIIIVSMPASPLYAQHLNHYTVLYIIYTSILCNMPIILYIITYIRYLYVAHT